MARVLSAWDCHKQRTVIVPDYHHKPNLDKAIYLDIDGVLNQFGGDKAFEPSCMAEFNRIVETTRASVFLCSSWRNLIPSYFSIDGFAYMMWTHGFTRPAFLRDTIDAVASLANRGRQIEMHAAYRGIKNVVILDDMPWEFGPSFAERFLRIDSGRGLTEEIADRAIALLGRD